MAAGEQLTESSLGRRVSVRRVVGSRDGRPVFSDVVGTLEVRDANRLVVRRRDGHRVEVDPRGIVAARVIPPGPARTASVAELEAAAALGWRATETAPLGDWLLRASAGFTGRANSVLPLGDPGRPLDSALGAAQTWYRGRGLPARFQVPLPLAEPLDAELDRLGWTAYSPVRVLAADLPDLLHRPDPPRLPPVEVADAPDDAWRAAYHYRGAPLPEHALAVLRRGDTLGFASARGPDGSVLGIARGSVDRGWLGVTAVEVVPAARRHGLGGVLLRALAGWAAEHGAHAVYLQVAVENEAAAALYLGRGFTDHHHYHYRVEP